MHSLPGMILFDLATSSRCFCMRLLRHHHFVRLIITAISNKSILVAGRESKHTNLTLIIINNSIIFSVFQNEIYTIRKPFEFHTNAFQTHFIMERRNYEAVKITCTLQWASGLTTAALSIYGVINLHGCSPV